MMFAKPLNAIFFFLCIYYFVITVKSLSVSDRFIKKHIMKDNRHVQAIPFMEIKNTFQEAQTVFSFYDNRTKHSFHQIQHSTPDKTKTVGELINLYNKYKPYNHNCDKIYFDEFKIEPVGAIDMYITKIDINSYKVISCSVSYDGYVVVCTGHFYQIIEINHMKALTLIKNQAICRDFNPNLNNICLKGG